MVPGGGRSVQCLLAGRFEAQGVWGQSGKTGCWSLGTKRTVLIGPTMRLVPWARVGMGAVGGWVGGSEVEG